MANVWRGSLDALVAEESRLAAAAATARFDDRGDGVTAKMLVHLIGVRSAVMRALKQANYLDAVDAIEAGATVREIADAQSLPLERAASDLFRWLDAQSLLRKADPDHYVGLSPSQFTLLRELILRDVDAAP